MISIDSFAFLPGSLQEPTLEAIKGGTMLSIATILLTVVLELASLPSVRGVLKQPDGPSLYLQAIALNFRNHFVFGIPVYAIAGGPLLSHAQAAENPVIFAMRAAGLMGVHAILYYSIHKAFHASPQLYVYHRFHHRFNTHVTPVVANAVTMVEYLLAYIIPFAVGAVVVNPHETELRCVVAVVSLCNLLIHTPRLEALSENLSPVFVTTHGHIDHHKRLNTNYAAPTLNVDWILVQLQLVFKKTS
jgi:sterol desaturase/sphingolipid hydroxylase (fatty acid hydroxylase superfamily)